MKFLPPERAVEPYEEQWIPQVHYDFTHIMRFNGRNSVKCPSSCKRIVLIKPRAPEKPTIRRIPISKINSIRHLESMLRKAKKKRSC